MNEQERKLARSKSNNEIVNLVDDNNNVIGPMKRQLVREQNLPHQASSIFTHNSKTGDLYVQKRTLIKDYCPGYYDPVSGGVLQYGEKYAESAERELEEELGIKGVDLIHCFTFHYKDNKTHVWSDAYCCHYDGEIKPQPEEVSDVELWSLKTLLRKMEEGEKICPDSAAAIPIYVQWLKDNRDTLPKPMQLAVDSLSE